MSLLPWTYCLETTLMNRLTHLSSFPQHFWHSENEILGFNCTPEGCHRQVSGSARFEAYFPSTVEYQRRRCPRGDTPSVPTPSWCNTGHVGTVGRGNVLEAIIILGGLTIPSLHMAGTADKYTHGSHDQSPGPKGREQTVVLTNRS